MMYVMVARVTIGAKDNRRAPLVIRRIVSAEGESSWRQLTAKCTVELSKKWYYREGLRGNLSTLVQQGDPITVEVGWGRTYNKEFVGYVAMPVLDRWPCRIECEDKMYLLKLHPVEKSWPSVSLHTFLRYILPKGVGFVAPENTDLGEVVMPRMNAAEALEQLRMHYGLVAYFRNDGKLRCGTVYLDQETKPVLQLHLQRSVLEDSLEFEPAPRVYVRVKTKLEQDSRLRWVERYAGEPTGDLRSFTRPGVQTADELQKIANQMLAVMARPGFRGRLGWYGMPYVEHSQKVELINEETPSQNGEYPLDTVSWRFSRGGYRRFGVLGAGGPRIKLQG